MTWLLRLDLALRPLWALGWAGLVSVWGFIKTTVYSWGLAVWLPQMWDIPLVVVFLPSFHFWSSRNRELTSIAFPPSVKPYKKQDFSNVFSKNMLPSPMVCLYVLCRRLSLRTSLRSQLWLNMFLLRVKGASCGLYQIIVDASTQLTACICYCFRGVCVAR